MSAAGVWNRGEVFAGGHHIATYANSTTTFTQADWLGTERARTNISGTVIETCINLPFGDGQSCSGSGGDPSPLHFTGKQRDAESGLDNFGARFYNSASFGRFQSPDRLVMTAARLANPQRLNLYAYAANNPLRFSDWGGFELIRVVVGDTSVVVDRTIAHNAIGFIQGYKAAGIPVSPNNAFRKEAEQTVLHDKYVAQLKKYNEGKITNKPNPVPAPGDSAHNAGKAIDMNGVGALTDEQKTKLAQIGADNGLPYAGDKDPMHFGLFGKPDADLEKEDQANPTPTATIVPGQDQTITVSAEAPQIDTEDVEILTTLEDPSQNAENPQPNNEDIVDSWEGCIWGDPSAVCH